MMTNEEAKREKAERRRALRKEAVASVRKAGQELGGQFMESTKPERAVAIVEAMAEGMSTKKLKAKFGLDWNQICRFRMKHGDLVRRRREAVAEDALELAEGARMLAMEKMERMAGDEEVLAATPLRDLALSYGIFIDKHHLATEGNRVVVEHQGSKAVSLADAVKAIEEAKALLRVKRESIEIVVSEHPPVSEPVKEHGALSA